MFFLLYFEITATFATHLTEEDIRKLKNAVMRGYKTNFPPPHLAGRQKWVERLDLKIPNIVHYVWFDSHVPGIPYYEKDLNMYKIIGPISAYKNLKPDKIILHSNQKPHGKWWDELRQIVPMEFEYYPLVEEVFGQFIDQPAHRSDVARIDIVRKYGGIYLDFDVVILKSFDPLRIYQCVMGIETGARPDTNGILNSGVILAVKNATFLNLWYEGYRKYHGNSWLYNSAFVPTELYYKHRDLLHIEYDIWHDTTGNIFNDIVDLSKRYAYHMWVKAGFRNVPRGIKRDYLKPQDAYIIDNTFGEILRKFYVDEHWKGNTENRERFH